MSEGEMTGYRRLEDLVVYQNWPQSAVREESENYDCNPPGFPEPRILNPLAIPAVFQAIPVPSPVIFPIIGKRPPIFSNHWKIPCLRRGGMGFA